jgi:hypothetical protein
MRHSSGCGGTSAHGQTGLYGKPGSELSFGFPVALLIGQHAKFVGSGFIVSEFEPLREQAAPEQFTNRGRPTGHSRLKSPMIDRFAFLGAQHDLEPFIACAIHFELHKRWNSKKNLRN